MPIVMKKVLLDENLPVKLKYRLRDVCDIFTVYERNWNALENGDLLEAMEEDDFDYLLTSDKNLQHQQNINKYTFGFIVLNVIDNNYETVLPLVEKIKQVLLNDTQVKLEVIS
jgi:reverse gyrase